MRRTARILAVATAGVLVTAVGPAAAHAAQAATAQCVYTPVLPKLIVVSRPTFTFHTPVRITAASGVDCTSNFAASESLAHSSDSYFLSWLYNSRTASDSVYAVTVVPGRYVTTSKSQSCSVTSPTDGTHPTCAVVPASTDIKFGGRVSLSATRLTGSNKDDVRLTVKATRYNPSATSYISTRVAIQRYDSRAWHTIRTVTTNGSRGAVFTYSDSHAAKYRAVTAATATVVGAVSGTVTG